MDYLLKEEVTEKSGVQTSGFTEKVEEIRQKVMTEINKGKAKKILKIAIPLTATSAIGSISNIIDLTIINYILRTLVCQTINLLYFCYLTFYIYLLQ